MAIGMAIAAAGMVNSIFSGGAQRAQQKDFMQAQLDQEAYRQKLMMDEMRTNNIYRFGEYQRQQENDQLAQRYNDIGMQIAFDDRDYMRELNDLQTQQFYDNYSHMMNRQAEMDRAAADQRAFEMEQLLKNQDLSQDQREWAEQQYEEAKQIAAGERDFDESQLLQNQERALQEYMDRVQRLSDYQTQAQDERQYDLDHNQRILDATNQYGDTLNMVRDQLGNFVMSEGFDRGDIEQEASKRIDRYQSNVDRAVDRIASVNEASNIRNGIDRSSTATANRADLAQRVAPMYDEAYTKAYDDAVAYISGAQQLENTSANQRLQERGAMYGEANNMAAPAQMMMQMQGARSAVSPVIGYDPGSAIYSGGVNTSALAGNGMANMVGAGIYDRMPQSSRMANTLPMQSTIGGLNGNMPGLNSPLFNHNANPAAYSNNNLAANFGSNVNGQFASMYGNMAAANSKSAGQALGYLANAADKKWGTTKRSPNDYMPAYTGQANDYAGVMDGYTANNMMGMLS